MKRSELKRKTPMKPGTKVLQARKPMNRGTANLRQSKPKPNGREVRRPEIGGDSAMLDACRGQPCYLLVPGIFRHDPETVVPCHSNQGQHGKGMGIKAKDEFTVPGCHACHAEIDQGNQFTKAEKFDIWDKAFERWRPVRDQLLVRKC